MLPIPKEAAQKELKGQDLLNKYKEQRKEEEKKPADQDD